MRLSSAVFARSTQRAACYAQVEKLLAERNSQHSIVRVTGVSRMTVAKLANKAQSVRTPLPRLRPKKAQRHEWEALELDEMWTFVGRRKRKVWLWLAVERASRRIVAWVTGRRDAATARRLWQALPRRCRRHGWYFTDLFPTYVGVLPRWQHRRCPKGSGGTSVIEAIHCSLRQRCGVLVRKSCSFSKSLPMHSARIKICIDQHNQRIMLP
ncbi:IS1 family transposase [Hymenobacter roseosalivarius]|uniref:IS1 family transposase n=1 Tax=Hymenobacter roseosalivarius TaxID=89967 RepID=UPI001356467C|nr:IS1 family transposase [Hymenobacter roseosalivarius]